MVISSLIPLAKPKEAPKTAHPAISRPLPIFPSPLPFAITNACIAIRIAKPSAHTTAAANPAISPS